MRRIKIVVKKHPAGYVAYPSDLKGVIVGEGGTYEGALAEKESDQFNCAGCSLFSVY